MSDEIDVGPWKWVNFASILVSAAFTMVAGIYTCKQANYFQESQRPYVFPQTITTHVRTDEDGSNERFVGRLLFKNYGLSPAHDVETRFRGSVHGIDIQVEQGQLPWILAPQSDPVERLLIVAGSEYLQVRRGAPWRFSVEFIYKDASGTEYAYCQAGRYMEEHGRLMPLTTVARRCEPNWLTADPKP